MAFLIFFCVIYCQIQVGDIIRVDDGDFLPCDVVLLSSSAPNGKANLLTANLDGETNLKVHSAPALTRGCQTQEALSRLRGVVECENPNADLTRFVGRAKVFRSRDEARMRTAGLSLENVALRGTQLRNTDFAYGCAVYTGADTKMSRNSKMTANKFSTVERSMNRYLIFFMALLFAEVLVATVLKYQAGYDRPDCGGDGKWYLGGEEVCEREMGQDVLAFVVLFNYIIPISLYVTLELQKFFGSFFMTWDLELYDEETDQPARCNSSDLNEELGQVGGI